jgi:hypothetical protein
MKLGVVMSHLLWYSVAVMVQPLMAASNAMVQ